MRIGHFVYGYAALMVGGILSLVADSPRIGFLAGGSIWALASLYARAEHSFVQDRSHVAADEFRRRWRSL